MLAALASAAFSIEAHNVATSLGELQTKSWRAPKSTVLQENITKLSKASCLQP